MQNKQVTLEDIIHGGHKHVTRKEAFLNMMDEAVPWKDWLRVIEPFYPKGTRGRPPIGLEKMLRMYLLQIWFNLSDPATEDAIYDSYAMRKFVGIDFMTESVPDETTLCKFRHLLEEHDLNQVFFDQLTRKLEEEGVMWKGGTIVDATIIASTSSTKNKKKERDPEMHQTRKGNQWYHGMKCHAAVDAGTGLVHSATFTAANVSDIVETHNLIRDEDEVVYGDAGYTGVQKRPEIVNDPHLSGIEYRIAEKIGKRRGLTGEARKWADHEERRKSSVRSKVEHIFHIVKNIFGYRKTAYRGLHKNGNRLLGLLASANLYMLANAGRTI